MDNVKDRVKALCRDNGITVQKLEKEIGMSNGTISKWDRYNPRVDKLTAVANYFNVPMETLTEDKKIPATDSSGYSKDFVFQKKKELADSLFSVLTPEDQDFAIDFLKKLAHRQ